MGIRFRCEHCSQKYELDESFAGRNAKCIHCHKKIKIPASSTLPPRANNASDTSGSIKRSVAVPVTDLLELKVKKVKSIQRGSKEASAKDIVFYCKLCNQKYRLPREMAGKTAECAKCKRNIVIPVPPDSQAVSRETAATAYPAAEPFPEEQSEIIFWCKLCRQKYRLASALAGREIKCARCKHKVTVPSQSETAAPPKREIPQTIPATPSDPALQVVFRCKTCSIKYRLAKGLAGVLVNCTKCQTLFEVPADSDPEFTIPAKPRTVKPVSQQQVQPKKVPAEKPAPPKVPQPKVSQSTQKDETVIETIVPKQFESGKTAIINNTSTTLNSFVKYVLEIPERNFFVGMLYGIGCFFSDWLKRLKIFRNVSENSIVISLGVLMLILSIYIFSSLFTASGSKNAPVKCKFNTMCEKCGHREVRKEVKLRRKRCTKCKGKIGAVWKCDDCSKFFPFFEERAPVPKGKKDMTGKLVKCPFCSSSNVHYVPPK